MTLEGALSTESEIVGSVRRNRLALAALVSRKEGQDGRVTLHLQTSTVRLQSTSLCLYFDQEK